MDTNINIGKSNTLTQNHTHTNRHTYWYTNKNTHAKKHTLTHTHTHTPYKHTCMHAHIHCAQAQTHAPTHIHTQRTHTRCGLCGSEVGLVSQRVSPQWPAVRRGMLWSKAGFTGIRVYGSTVAHCMQLRLSQPGTRWTGFSCLFMLIWLLLDWENF